MTEASVHDLVRRFDEKLSERGDFSPPKRSNSMTHMAVKGKHSEKDLLSKSFTSHPMPRMMDSTSAQDLKHRSQIHSKKGHEDSEHMFDRIVQSNNESTERLHSFGNSGSNVEGDLDSADAIDTVSQRHKLRPELKSLSRFNSSPLGRNLRRKNYLVAEQGSFPTPRSIDTDEIGMKRASSASERPVASLSGNRSVRRSSERRSLDYDSPASMKRTSLDRERASCVGRQSLDCERVDELEGTVERFSQEVAKALKNVLSSKVIDELSSTSSVSSVDVDDIPRSSSKDTSSLEAKMRQLKMERDKAYEHTQLLLAETKFFLCERENAVETVRKEKTRIRELTSELNRLREKLRAMETEQKQVIADKKIVEKQRDIVFDKHEQSAQKTSNVEAELKQAKDSLESTRQEIGFIKAELHKTQEEEKRAKTEVRNLRASLCALQPLPNSGIPARASGKQQAFEADNQTMLAANAQKTARALDKTRHELQTAVAEKQKLTATVQSLQRKLAEAQSLQEKSDSARDWTVNQEIDSLTQAVKDAKVKLDEAVKAKDYSARMLGVVMSEKTSVIQQMQNALSEKDSLAMKLKSLEDTVQQYEQEKTEATTARSSLEEELENLNGEKVSLKEEIAHLQKELEKLEANGKTVDNMMSALEETVDKLEDEAQDKEKELLRLSAQMGQYEDEIEATTKDRDTWKTNAEKLSSTLQQLQQKYVALKEERDDTVEDLDAEVEVLKLELKSLQEEHAEASSMANLQKLKKSHYKQLHRRARNDLEEVVAHLDSNAAAMAHCEQVSAQNQKLKEELEAIRETAVTVSLLEADQKQKAKLVDALRVEVQELQAEGDSLEADIDRLATKNAELEKINAGVQRELELVQAEGDSLEADVDRLAKRNLELEKTNTDLQQELELAQTQLERPSITEKAIQVDLPAQQAETLTRGGANGTTDSQQSRAVPFHHQVTDLSGTSAAQIPMVFNDTEKSSDERRLKSLALAFVWIIFGALWMRYMSR